MAASFCLAHLATTAQVVTISSGTLVSALSPINHASAHGVYEAIYLQSQINQAGSITKLVLFKNDGSITTPLDSITIYLKTTTDTFFNAGTIDSTGYTRVFRGAFTNSTAAGLQEVVLSRPFSYNNVGNLAVLIIRRGGTNINSTVGTRARYLYGNASGRNASRRYTGTAPITSTTALSTSTILANLSLTFGTAMGARNTVLAPAAGLFPNPAAETTTLDARQWRGQLYYFITDALGRVVRPVAVLPATASGQHQLALQGLPAGAYHLHLSNGIVRRVLPLVHQ